MKKFSFSLEKVLEYSSHLLKKEKETLQKLKAELMALNSQETFLLKKLEHQKNEYIRLCGDGISLPSAGSRLKYIGVLRDEIKELKAKIEAKKKQIETQTGVVIEVTKEKTKVEKLKEAKYKLYITNEQKEEERFIEEFVSHKSALTA